MVRCVILCVRVCVGGKGGGGYGGVDDHLKAALHSAWQRTYALRMPCVCRACNRAVEWHHAQGADGVMPKRQSDRPKETSLPELVIRSAPLTYLPASAARSGRREGGEHP
jgi:hypothetical protein